MSFATSLLALSLHALATQPTKSAHSGTEAAYCNFFTSMGANICQNVKIPSGKGVTFSYWCPDMVVDFGDFQVIVEVKTHCGLSRNAMGFITKSIDRFSGKEYVFDNLHGPVKQVLAYYAKGESMWMKPTICLVVSNLEFVIINPQTFNRKALLKNISVQPSSWDGKACDWVKSQKAFKSLVKHSVSALNKITPDEFKAMLRKEAGLPDAPEVRMVAE